MNRLRRQHNLEVLGITPWLRREAPTAAQTAASTSVTPTSATAVPPSSLSVAPVSASSGVREAAAPISAKKSPAPENSAPVPTDWDGLRAAVSGCTRCKLCHTRTNTVFGVGPQNAPLMVIGEGPGADEDAKGEPFVGRAGRLLDEMLKTIGRSRDDNTFIANVVKCRPPGNRDPEADEVAACRPYLEQQIRLLKPRLIVGLGRVAAQRLLSTDLPMSKLRGQLHEYQVPAMGAAGEESTPVLLTYHPAYLLRSPREKAKSWVDLKQIHRFLEPPV